MSSSVCGVGELAFCVGFRSNGVLSLEVAVVVREDSAMPAEHGVRQGETGVRFLVHAVVRREHGACSLEDGDGSQEDADFSPEHGAFQLKHAVHSIDPGDLPRSIAVRCLNHTVFSWSPSGWDSKDGVCKRANAGCRYEDGDFELFHAESERKDTGFDGNHCVFLRSRAGSRHFSAMTA